MRSRLREKRWLLWAASGLAIVLVLGVAAVLVLSSREQGDVSNPDVEFRSTSPDEPAQQPLQNTGRRHSKGNFDWPVYGYTKARTRYLPLKIPLRPPFAERWKRSGSVLLEFPPVLGKRSLYLLKNNGALYGMTRKTGKLRWKRKLGYLAASSPAYAHNTVYVVVLQRGKGIKAGRVTAVSAKDGHTRWSRKLPSRAESSPLIDRGNLYFGTEDGTVYALRASDGFVRWRYKAPGAVKGGVALDDGRLFFGDYSGHVQAVRARDGKLLWRKGTSGGTFGLSSGNFYSTAAAAYGRVYLGNTDGFVYSYAQDDGELAWRKKTGGYVYGSPAVASVPGGGPTVYIGSYDGTFYALDARSGRVRWSRKAEGRISGGAVVLGDLVFYSTLSRTTTALGARTGQRVWSTHRGAFNPVVSNGRGLFLVGYTNLYGIDTMPPGKRTEAHRRAAAKRAHKRQVARRVAKRRRAVHRRNRLRDRGVRFCYRSHGHRVCRLPKPLVCVKGANGRTTCRVRRPRVCFKRPDGKRVCRPARHARR
jgi:outer membrane protein assembly factor BamB